MYSQVTRSGTLTVTATVNGQTQSASVHIAIRRPVLKISPERSDLLVGDTLVHTASVTPATKRNGGPAAWQVTSWRFQQTVPQYWTGQACGAVTSCKTGPYAIYDQARIIVYATINGTADSAEAVVYVRNARLKLTAQPTGIQSGDSVVFTASSAPAGFSISISGWKWVPGDGSPSTVPTCTGGGLVCRTKINKSGTMLVFGTVGTGGSAPDSADATVTVANSCPAMNVMAARLPTSRLPRANASVFPLPCFDPDSDATRPKLKLTCTANGSETYKVTRGTTVSCTATGNNNEPIDGGADVKWHFEGGGFTTDSTFQGATWTGPLVVGGAIQVEATVSGQSLHGERGLKVEKRDWSSKAVPFEPLDSIINNDKNYRPRRSQDLANQPENAKVIVRFRTESGGPANTAVVDQGPNARLVYFTDVPVKGTLKIFVARGALSDSSAFWFNQPAGPAAYPGSSVCTRGDIPNFVPLMEAHEGFPDASGPYPFYSHTGIFTREFTSRARNELERYVGWFGKTQSASDNESSFKVTALPRFQKLVDDAYAQSALLDRTNVPGPLAAFPFCGFAYFP